MSIKVRSIVKFDVDKFMVGTTSFWDMLICALLVQQGLFKTLKGVDNLSEKIDGEEK